MSNQAKRSNQGLPSIRSGEPARADEDGSDEAKATPTRSELAKRALFEAEVVRLREEGRLLERDWRRIPFLFGFVLLAAPAYWIWGPLASLYALLFVPCLLLTAVYLVGVRRRENDRQIEDFQGHLDRWS